MTWTRHLDWYLDFRQLGSASSPLLSVDDDGASSIAQTPVLVQGDAFPLRLYCRERTDDGVDTVEIPSDSAIVLGGKKLSDIGSGPLLFSADSFALVGSGADAYWTADLDLHTANLDDALGTDAQITVRIDIEIQNPANSERQSFQFDVTIRRQAYAGEGDPDPAEPEYPTPSMLVVKYCGTEAIANGADDHTVTGLGLDFTPAQCLVSVRKPSQLAANIFATIRDDSISDDGFIVDLSAATPSAGYKLDYLIIEAP